MKTIARMLLWKSPAFVCAFVHARTHPLHGASCAPELVVDTRVMESCSTCFLSEGKMRDAGQETEYRITLYQKEKNTILLSCSYFSLLIENVSICVCCKLFCLSLCCNDEERRECVRPELLKEWTLSGCLTEALIVMFGYTSYCIFRLPGSKCADLKTFMSSVCLQKGKTIAMEELYLCVQGLKRVLQGYLYLCFYVLYVAAATCCSCIYSCKSFKIACSKPLYTQKVKHIS